MIANNLLEEIQIRRERRLRSLAKASRQICPRASSITECPLEMVYSIVKWDTKPLPDPTLMARFEEGKEQERKVIRELMDLGFEIVEGQKPFEIRGRKGNVILTGSIDGKCLWKDKKVPFEVKSLDPNIYNSIDSVEDFNKYEWARKYPRQMQCYLFGYNEEEGLFIITDCKGHWKLFTVTLDIEEMERILQLCEYVMDCIESNKWPDYHKNASICRRCWALGRVCTPPLEFDASVQVIDDPEIEAKLSKREALKSSSKEFVALDKEIKAYFKGRPNSLCGDFIITGKEQIRKMPPQEARDVKSWVTRIEKIENKS